MGPIESRAMAQAAQALLSSAHEHKVASRRHREAAKKCMQDLAKLQESCRSLGIRLEVA